MKTVLLRGGPLDGVVHEVASGFEIPDGLSFEKDGMRHHYVTQSDRTVRHAVANFDFSEVEAFADENPEDCE